MSDFNPVLAYTHKKTVGFKSQATGSSFNLSFAWFWIPSELHSSNSPYVLININCWWYMCVCVCVSFGKESTCNVGDLDSILVLGKAPGEGKGYPLQYSSLGKSPWRRERLPTWTTYSLFCSITFCHLPGNFIIPSSQNFLSSWTENYSKCLLQSSRELEFFPLNEFCKDQNKWKSKGAMVQCLVNMADESELPSQPKKFLSGHQRNMQFCIILVEDFAFSAD